MDAVPASSVAFPAFWFFLLGSLLALGVLRAFRERHDVRDDWTRLVRFNDALTRVEATGGRDSAARLELLALAEALDDAVVPRPGRPGLAEQVARFDGERHPGVHPGAVAAALRDDVLAADRALQARMRAQARSQGHVGRLFLAGAGGVLLVPLEVARALGLVERLTARRVEQSLWFHGALGVVVFIVLAGTAYAVLSLGRLAGGLASGLAAP